jgi:DNA repair photolyase
VITLADEIQARTALSPSSLPGLDWALNPYKGCGHACAYCYAPSVLRDARPWGSYVEAKANVPELLGKELAKKAKGVVGIGTVTDAYQPAEAATCLTRRCLEVLLRHDWPVCIQTKSALVLRDMDLISRFSQREIGVTITTADEAMRRIFEPGAPAFEERLGIFRAAREHGIKAWLFLGPILPGATDAAAIISAAADAGAGSVIYDRLRLKPGIRERLSAAMPAQLASSFLQASGEGFFKAKYQEIEELCKKYGLNCRTAF